VLAAADGLPTEFRLRRSILVPALAENERIKLTNVHVAPAGYGFFSYGDACLIERPP
jgi:S-adenosylmethionine:tRNA-ribosyltransferase-isomerase (queuine synthetase)